MSIKTKPKMSLKKTIKASLRSKYPVISQFGLVLTLMLLIAAFKFDIFVVETEVLVEEDLQTFELEDMHQTEQREKIPPPIKPSAPIEVPDEDVLDDEELDIDSEIDFDDPIDFPAPPVDEVEKEEPDVFIVVEQMPALIGGGAAIAKSVKYPEMAKKAGVEGRVYLQFVVDEEGNVLDPSVIKGVGAGCDEEALRVVRNLKFKPGRQRGTAVKVQFSLSINFQLK